MVPQQETKAPIIDALEIFGLLALPVIIVDFGLSAISGTENLTEGMTIGGLFGITTALMIYGLLYYQ